MNQYHDDTFLSGAALKDRAKAALNGKYGKMILAGIVVSGVTLACQLVLSFTGSFLVSIYVVVDEVLLKGIPLEQLETMLADGSYPDAYDGLFTVVNYCLGVLSNIFITVFNIGTCLFCLNLACGRRLNIADVFYGFRSGFGKSLRLTTLVVLVGQLYALPFNILYYLIEQDASPELILLDAFFLAVCLVIYIPLSLGISQVFLLSLDFPGYSAMELLKLSIRIMEGHKGRLFYIQLSFIPLIMLSFLSLGIGFLWLNPYMNVTYTFFFLNLMQAREPTRTC